MDDSEPDEYVQTGDAEGLEPRRLAANVYVFVFNVRLLLVTGDFFASWESESVASPGRAMNMCHWSSKAAFRLVHTVSNLVFSNAKARVSKANMWTRAHLSRGRGEKG
ncbi:hypothetical protein AX14_011095 [Amanita brunnescens Koide BX004]|nr:hypothetical protein AX14_011095 [Amanita brunnescens Koide BX004]